MKLTITFEELIEALSGMLLQTKIITGTQDASGGYGWHTVWHIEIIECVEYCEICRDRTGENFTKDDSKQHTGRHKPRAEYNTVFSKGFRSINHLIPAVVSFCIDRGVKDNMTRDKMEKYISQFKKVELNTVYQFKK